MRWLLTAKLAAVVPLQAEVHLRRAQMDHAGVEALRQDGEAYRA